MIFKWMKNKKVALHSAGAVVNHHSLFSDLAVPENSEELGKEFLEKWVFPFYMTPLSDQDFHVAYAKIHSECDLEIVKQLLGEFNWRPRRVGAYFSAIAGFNSLETVIGNLLLRSDVCYAGGSYCLALAQFNTKTSLDFIEEYLRYYLEQKDLWFDQSAAMSAVAYLDKINGTDNLAKFIPQWQSFMSNKPNWNLEKSVEGFWAAMLSISALQKSIAE
jgi:Family of unknown function (DUF6000)